MYNKVTSKDVSKFISFTDISRVKYQDEIPHDYSKDEMGTIVSNPEVVITVLNSKEISDIVAYANENKIPLLVRGSGTGLVGACVPIFNGIVLDTTKMNKILELDEENMTLTLEPGVLLMDIYKYVEPLGYFYAPDPGEKSATIGGNISTNAGGMRAVKYGVTRDWVRALEVVLPDGSIEQFGRKVVKDSTGYSLKNLIIGSEGTLGIITKAILKLEPLPTETLSLLVPFESAREGIEAVPKIIKSKVTPTAIEFFERNTLIFAEDFLGKKFPDTKSDSYILLTFDASSKEELEQKYKVVADLMITQLNAKDVLIVDTVERKESVWSARGAFLEAIKASTSLMDECDVVVPRNKVADYINFTYDLADKYNIRIPSFGHAGDGNLHIYVCKDDLNNAEFEVKLEQIFEEMYEEAKNVGGLVSGEHGVGYAKKKYMKNILGENQINLMKRIKLAFDPNNILNPGKIID